MPNWKHTFNVADVFHDESLAFEEKRDTIAKRLKAAPFYTVEIEDIVWRVETAEDEDDFNYWWDNFYDYADADRIWVETVRVSRIDG